MLNRKNKSEMFMDGKAMHIKTLQGLLGSIQNPQVRKEIETTIKKPTPQNVCVDQYGIPVPLEKLTKKRNKYYISETDENANRYETFCINLSKCPAEKIEEIKAYWLNYDNLRSIDSAIPESSDVEVESYYALGKKKLLNIFKSLLGSIQSPEVRKQIEQTIELEFNGFRYIDEYGNPVPEERLTKRNGKYFINETDIRVYCPQALYKKLILPGEYEDSEKTIKEYWINLDKQKLSNSKANADNNSVVTGLAETILSPLQTLENFSENNYQGFQELDYPDIGLALDLFQPD